MEDRNINDAHRSKTGTIRRLWHVLKTPSAAYLFGGLLAVGGIAGILFWGGFNWAMELTNTETFCISCHEMRVNAYVEYKETVHYNNRSGVRATCPDCHVPKEWIHKVKRKIVASNELFHHFAGSVSTPEEFDAKRLKLASNVWRAMKSTDSRECRNCHNFDYMDFTLQETRSGKAHQEAIDTSQTCIDCHQGIAHTLPEGAADAYKAVEAETPERVVVGPARPVRAGTLDQLRAYLSSIGN